MREQRIVLEDEADVTLVRRRMRHAAAEDVDLAVRRRLEAGNHQERGGLARARRTEESHELALADVQREVANHERAPVIALVDILETHHRLAAALAGSGARLGGLLGRGVAHVSRPVP